MKHFETASVVAVLLTAPALLGMTACQNNDPGASRAAADKQQPSNWSAEQIISAVQEQMDAICDHRQKPYTTEEWAPIAQAANAMGDDLPNSALADPNQAHQINFQALEFARIATDGYFKRQVEC